MMGKARTGKLSWPVTGLVLTSYICYSMYIYHYPFHVIFSVHNLFFVKT